MPNEIRAKLNYLRMAPRKVRLVANSIKGLTVNEAEAHLLTISKRAGVPLLKLLRSAVNNAKGGGKVDIEKLVVKKIAVDKGPVFKRFMPRAMGRATKIEKKTSHIILILAESEKAKAPRFKTADLAKMSKKLRKKEQIDEKSRTEENEKPKAQERKKERRKSDKEPGFMKKMFRRKAI